MTRVITLLTDYGLRDEFAGVLHGVIAGLAPDARVIDLTHGIPRHAVLPGALVLERTLPYVPAGVHVAVVDPEVGARRRAVALRTAAEDRLLVGPDNGVLVPAAQRFGGAVEAVELSASPWRLQPVSATFHGRDLFAPVAARLARGEPLAEAGAPFDPDDLVALARPRARIEAGALVAEVLHADGFGNVELGAGHKDLAAAGIKLGRRVTLHHRDRTAQALVARTFADAEPGELLLYEDAAGLLAVALNTGDAASALGLRPGDEVRIA